MKKGFTLIELLAVIVILAIIALIAFPIVINIINDTKNSSDEQSVELYKDIVEKMITKKQLSNPNFNPDKCKIQENGNLKCYKNNELIPGKIEIDMKESMPSKGTIIFKNNKIDFSNVIFNNVYYYEKGVLVDDADNNNEISIGDKYTYKVNDIDTFNFYVLSIDNDNVNLIMDRNICGYPNENDSRNGQLATEQNTCLIAWYAQTNDNRKGPITAMHGLYNATKNWANVPDMILSYDDIEDNYVAGYSGSIEYGYTRIFTDVDSKVTTIEGKNTTEIYNFGNIEFPLKARLPKYSELETSSVKLDSGIVKAWLVDNLEYLGNYTREEKNSILGIKGYWLMNSNPGARNNARKVFYDGWRTLFPTDNYKYSGIRPVITVPRSYLEN